MKTYYFLLTMVSLTLGCAQRGSKCTITQYGDSDFRVVVDPPRWNVLAVRKIQITRLACNQWSRMHVSIMNRAPNELLNGFPNA